MRKPDPACRSLKSALVGLAVLALVPSGAFGQAANTPDARPKSAAPQTATAAPPAAVQVVMPGAEKVVLLLRATLITLNDALQTGNFTVLRDMAAPSFRESNSGARLSEIFANLMRQNPDLTAVAILMPQLAEPPALDANTGMLRIRGSFPGQAIRLDFDIVYQAVAGRWRLFGIAVQPAAATPETAILKDAPAKGVPDSASKFSPAKALTPPTKKTDAPKAEPPKK